MKQRKDSRIRLFLSGGHTAAAQIIRPRAVHCEAVDLFRAQNLKVLIIYWCSK